MSVIQPWHQSKMNSFCSNVSSEGFVYYTTSKALKLIYGCMIGNASNAPKDLESS